MSITLNRIGFFIRHIARMRRTREALNQLLPPHQQLIGVWRSLHNYINVYAGRITCRTCLPLRWSQLMGHTTLCGECHRLSDETWKTDKGQALARFETLFALMGAEEGGALRPKGGVRGIAVILINTECYDLAVIGCAALISFFSSWSLLIKNGYLVVPYLVSGSVDPNFYVQKALNEQGRAHGFDTIQHFEIISHGDEGNLLLSIHDWAITALDQSGTIVLNACTAYISAQHFAQHNPDAHVFASQTFTVVSEPHIIMTPEGPRTRGVVHGTNFLTPLVWGERMQRFMRSSPDRAHR